MKTKNLILKISQFFFLVSLVSLGGCGADYVPKPKGLNFIELPEQKYRLFNENDKPYTFEYSVHALALDDTASSFRTKKKLYKILKYPELNSSIHLTYKNINRNSDSLDSYINEAYRLAYGHDVKAYGITPEVGTLPNGNHLTTITLEGDVPSHYQFFVHDSTEHFLRGVIYFSTANKNDSLAPVIDFVKQDAQHLIQTLEWKD